MPGTLGNENENVKTYDTVEFCLGIDANIVTDATKIIKWNTRKNLFLNKIHTIIHLKLLSQINLYDFLKYRW